MNIGIALGSNLGDRLLNLQQAVALLSARVPELHVLAASPVYETDPVDCPPGSPGFLNAVIEISAPIAPLDLLRITRGIEAELGRPNVHDHHAPRTVDLDLLYADDVALQDPDLILPHPRMTARRFVLQPLADIRPRMHLPGESRTVEALLAQLPISAEPPLRVHTPHWLEPDRP